MINKIKIKYFGKTENSIIDNYRTYYFTKKEFVGTLITAILKVTAIGTLFYNSIIGIIFLSPFIIVFINKKQKDLMNKRLGELEIEFKDAIISISSGLNTGYSLENAVLESLKDMQLMYSNGIIVKELSYMVNQIKMNINIEIVIYEFGERSGLEDIINFAEVIKTAKRTGGDMIKIIKSTCEIIAAKIEVKREIETMIAAKKLEQKVMSMIPFGIILYMWLTSPDFMSSLYNNLSGFLVMTICLGLYYVSVMLSNKIMNIHI